MDKQAESKILDAFHDRIVAVIEILLCEWSEDEDIDLIADKVRAAFPSVDLADWVAEEVAEWKFDAYYEDPADDYHP